MEDVSIGNRLLPVSGEAVEFPDEDHIKTIEVRIRDYSLELRAVVVGRRHCSVDVGVDDVDVVRSGEFLAFSNLALVRLFSLLVAGILGVDDTAKPFSFFGFEVHEHSLLVIELMKQHWRFLPFEARSIPLQT